jgi:hypothetical protein
LSNPFKKEGAMKKTLLAAFAALIAWNSEVTGQVLVTDYALDTSEYAMVPSYKVFPGPNYFATDLSGGGMNLYVYKAKNGDRYDFFSFSGKFSSVTIPASIVAAPDSDYHSLLFSQTFVDNDTGWECIVNYYDVKKNYALYFKVFDGSGASDTGLGTYGFDGYNTYVVQRQMTPTIKAWRFRTNISSVAPNSLGKTAALAPHAMMTFGMNGDYRIKLAPAQGGKMSVRLFDMLGRTVFTRYIDRITAPVTLTISEGDVPPGPFITKVQDKNGAMVKREIPVK